jgi:hypothetical protein
MSSSVIRDNFRLANLSKFIKSLSATDTLYVGIGRPQFWDTSTIPNNDAVLIEDPLWSSKNNLISETSDREDLMSCKRVNVTDVSHGILKEVWTSGKKYDIYRHDWDGSVMAVDGSFPASLATVKCIVINNEYDIYMCIKQGKTGTIINPSIYSPETGQNVGGATTGVLKTADGYYWKFLAKTTGAEIATFSSITHHPVKTLKVAPSEIDVVNYYQWTSQLNSASYKSGIYTINVVNGGGGYNGGVAGTRVVASGSAETDPEFKIIGNGSNIGYTVTYGAGGTVTDIEITNPGTGYTHATISATGGSNLVVDVIYTPSSGLGCDPVKDTSALYFLCTVSLNDDEGGKFTIDNDYRKVCLISNPFNYGTSVVATSSTVGAYITLTFSSVTDGANTFAPDQIVTGASSGAKARIIDFDGVNVLRVIRTSSENLGQLGANNNFLVGETVAVGSKSGIVSNVTLPDIDTRTGEVIYSEYKSNPTLRGPGQTETIKIIVEF